MHNSKELERKIQAHISLHGARISFMTRFIMALIGMNPKDRTRGQVTSRLNDTWRRTRQVEHNRDSSAIVRGYSTHR